jgi:hypothetical protein
MSDISQMSGGGGGRGGVWQMHPISLHYLAWGEGQGGEFRSLLMETAPCAIDTKVPVFIEGTLLSLFFIILLVFTMFSRCSEPLESLAGDDPFLFNYVSPDMPFHGLFISSSLKYILEN